MSDCLGPYPNTLIGQTKVVNVALLPHLFRRQKRGTILIWASKTGLTHREASPLPPPTAWLGHSPKKIAPSPSRQLLKPRSSSLYFFYFHLLSLKTTIEELVLFIEWHTTKRRGTLVSAGSICVGGGRPLTVILSGVCRPRNTVLTLTAPRCFWQKHLNSCLCGHGVSFSCQF